jgi:hypothetical protein
VTEAYQDTVDLRVKMEFQESRVYLETQVCLVYLDPKQREAMKENLEYLADQVTIFPCTDWN